MRLILLHQVILGARRDDAAIWRLSMKIRIAKLIPGLIMLALIVALPSFLPVHATGDFTITATPSDLGNHIIVGSRHSVTINVTSTGGFSGTVSLSASTVTSVNTTFTPTTVTVSSGGFATSMLKITFGDCPIGSPPLTVTGQSGTLSHWVNIKWEGPIIC
jgi:hypothetical protein